MNLRAIFLFAFILITFIFSTFSQAQVILGKIVTELNQPLAYTTIYVQETKTGTITNTYGDFSIQLDKGTYNLTIRSLGFIQIEKEVELNTDTLFLNLVMKRQEFQIKEVKVFPGKEDPAYYIIRKAITKAQYYRNKIKHYEADLYIKANFAFSNIPRLIKKQEIEEGKKFKDFFKENVTYVIESQNKITFDYPNKYDQKVISKKTSLVGFDEPPVMGLMTSSFYEERTNQVISPLSSMALKHYTFQYEGFITVGSFDVFKIRVIPKRNSDELVMGHIYIVDKLWCIYNLDFRSSFEFFNYHIKQQFENLGNENWLPVSHSIDGNFGMLGLRGVFYYGASVKYDSIVDNYFTDDQLELISDKEAADTVVQRSASEKEKILKQKVEEITVKEELTNSDVKKVARLNRKILKEQYQDSTIATSGFSNYNIDESPDSLLQDVGWDTLRAIPLTPAEIESYQLADSINTLESMETDSITGEKKKKRKSLLSKIVFGHYDLCKDSLIRLSYDGLISTENFDFNTVDGYKVQQSIRLRYNPDSARYMYFTPVLGYAFNRKTLYGSLDVQFRSLLAYGNTIGFSVGKESRDFKPSPLGILPDLNGISSWFFGSNYMKLYETEFYTFNVSQKVKKHFTISSVVKYNRFFPLENSVSYKLSDKKEYSPNIPKGFTEDSPELQQQNSFDYTLGLNFRKNQPKPWLQNSPFLFIDDFYEFNIYFRQGLKNVFSSDSDFSQIDFRFHQQANLSPGAALDWRVNAGYFFNTDQMHFSQFKHFRTAEIPVLMSLFTHTFQGINDYEFSTNKSYLNINTEFKSEYMLLRYLSLFNKRTWSESLHFNYLTTPDLKNYWEAGYSINSLFFIGNIGVFTGFEGSKFESVLVKFAITGFD